MAKETTILAGSAKIELSPPLGLPIMGRCRLGGIMAGKMNATGSYTPLCARAVLFQQENKIIGFCSIDVCVISRESIERVMPVTKEILGELSDVTIVATHTHSAPPGWKEFGFFDDKADTWLQRIEECIIEAVKQAKDALVPARITFGRTEVLDIASNRRLKMPDGRLDMNFLVDDPTKGEPCGPFDPELLVLQVESLQDNPIALISNFACHQNVLLETEHLDYCAEPFGMAMLHLEKEHPGLVGLHFPGAMGDINTCTFHRDRSHKGEEQIADLFYKHIKNAIAEPVPITPSPFSVQPRCVEVDYRPLPEAEELNQEIKGLMEQLAEAETRKDTETVWQIKRLISHRQALLDYIERGGNPDVMMPLNYKIIRIGQMLFVTCPGELFVEYGLELKKQARLNPCMVVGYADDYRGYFPTSEAFEQGGYEPRPSIYSLAEHQAGNKYLQHAIEGLRSAIIDQGEL